MPRRGEGHGHQPTQRNQSDEHVSHAAHLHDDCGRHAERNRRQQLIANAEERPERINSAERILDALPEEISPRGNDHRAGKKNRWIPTGAPERLPDVAQRILQHEASDAGTGVNDGEDEQRFEHDGEVIPESHDRLSAESVGKNLRHAHSESGRAAGAVVERLLADSVRERSHLGGGDWESPGTDRGRGRFGRLPHNTSGAVDREVDAGLQHRSRDHGHDRDHRLGHHASVADHAGFRFAADQLRSSAT